MRAGLLVLWIALVGADRIDFLAGQGAFMLKPILLLSPLIIASEALELSRRDRVLRLPRELAWYFVLLTTLLCLLLLSVMHSTDMGIAIRRWALLAVEAYSCLLVVVLLGRRADARGLLLRGAVLGLSLSLLFDVAQMAWWFGAPLAWMELGGVIELSPAAYGPWLPRPSGISLDANRGGLLIVFYLYLVWELAPRSRSRAGLLGAGVLALLLTLSRSAVLTALIAAGLRLVQRGVRLSRGAVGGAAATLAAGAAVLLASPEAREALLRLLEILGGRFSLGEGSSSEHLALLARGWDVATRSVPNLLFGIGFGNSFLELQDFFPGTKYGNFHSLYVTLLVEAGVFSLIPAMLLLLYPLVRGGSFQALIAGLVFFNIFYQAHVESIFWFMLSLAWLMPGVLDAAAAFRQGAGLPAARAADAQSLQPSYARAP